MKLQKITSTVALLVLVAGIPASVSASSNYDNNVNSLINMSHNKNTNSRSVETIVKTEEIKFDTRIETDKVLPKGVEIIIQEGQKGTRTFYQSNEKSMNSSGKVGIVTITSNRVTSLPVEKVVYRGTNDEVIDGISDKTKKIEKEKAEKIAKEKAEAERKAAEEHAVKSASRSRSSNRSYSTKASGNLTSPAENRAYAQSVLSASEFACADILVNRESGWQTGATNPSSGAYGVPQSLPAGKMASAGADWRTNGKTQVKWMQNYVKGRYGNFCNAVNFSDRKGWY